MANLKASTITGGLIRQKGTATLSASPATKFITYQEGLNGTVIFTCADHGLADNTPIVLTASTGMNLGGNAVLPTNISASTTYYVRPGSDTTLLGGGVLYGYDNNFRLATAADGAYIAWGGGFQGAVSAPGHTFTGGSPNNILTIDYATGNYFEVDLNNTTVDITTLTITNPPASGDIGSFTLKIINGSSYRWSTNNIIDWEAPGVTPKWNEGNFPGAGGVNVGRMDTTDLYKFETTDGGTTWYAEVIGTTFVKANYAASFNEYGERGIFGGGDESGVYQTIDYINIETPGNAKYFGDLTVQRKYIGAVSDGSRGVFGPGNDGPPAPYSNDTIDYITIATYSNATDFGNSTLAREGANGVEGGGRGVWAGGWMNATPGGETIDYITIATPGNAADFGNLHSSTLNNNNDRDSAAAVSNGIRGVWAGGYVGSGNGFPNSRHEKMDYITIATTGNATAFGDLTIEKGYPTGVSDGSRGVNSPGDHNSTSQRTIDYITVAHISNAKDFGDTTYDCEVAAGVSNGTRGVWGGNDGPPKNTIAYITIAIPGNAADFGDLYVARFAMGGTAGN